MIERFFCQWIRAKFSCCTDNSLWEGWLSLTITIICTKLIMTQDVNLPVNLATFQIAGTPFTKGLYRHRNDPHHWNDLRHRNNPESPPKWSPEPKWYLFTIEMIPIRNGNDPVINFRNLGLNGLGTCKHDSKQRKIEKAIRLITVLYTDFIFKVLTLF